MALCLVILSTNLIAQIKVNSSGYVGINNTNPAYRLDVNGDMKLVTSGGKNFYFSGSSIYANPSYNADLGSTTYMWYRLYATTAYFTYNPVIGSDIKFKTNITDLSPVKDKIKLLRPVTYNLKTDLKELQIDKTMNILQYGFIAQELQEVFPEMVTTRDDGAMGICYTELIPVLVQALKEQQAEIDVLTKRITDLEGKVK